MIFSLFQISAFAADESSVTLGKLTSDEQAFFVKSSNKVTFTIDIQNVSGKVNLYEGKQAVSTMNDDAVSGDAVAGDGVFTCQIDVNEENETSRTFHAFCSGEKSNDVELEFFKRPNQKLIANSELVQERLNFFEQQYESGKLSKEEAITAVSDYAKNLKQSNKIESYNVNKNGITINHKSGATVMFSPKIPETYSSGSEINVYTIQPWYTECKGIKQEEGETPKWHDLPNDVPSEYKNDGDIIRYAGKKIDETFENCKYDEAKYSSKDEKISLETIKKLGPNQIVIWQGHGVWDYSFEYHSALLTGNKSNLEKMEDPEYYLDVCSKRIVFDGEDECITSKYIDHYCGNLENSFIYLGPCESGHDSVLAQSFLDKGARAVIGNTRTIAKRYGDLVQYATITKLTEIDTLTNEKYTLGFALDEAKYKYGETDAKSGKYAGAVGAEPVLFGGSAAYNYRLGNSANPVCTLSYAGVNTTHSKLQDAVDACPINGSKATIKLCGNVSLDKLLSISNKHNIVLDLNKYSIKKSATAEATAFPMIYNCGNLTIKASTTSTNAVVTSYNSTKEAVRNDGKLSVLSGYINGNIVNKNGGKIVKFVPPATQITSLKPAKKSFIVSVKKLAKAYSNGYQIRYSLKKNMAKSKTVTISTNPNIYKKTISKLASRKIYYVQSRNCKSVAGKKYYSAWSKTSKVKTK